MASHTSLFSMRAGGAIRISNYTEVGSPHLVNVTAQVARRAQYMEVRHLSVYWEDEGPDEYLCAVFRDPKTGEVYGQPIEGVPS